MTINTVTFSFNVGKFACIAVSDGFHTYAPPTFPSPVALLFVGALREQLKQGLAAHNLEPGKWLEWQSPYICLVVDTGSQLVLVDTGADGISPDTGKLVSNLKSVGIAPGDIDIVVLTHGHPDHIGGNTDDDGKPVFRNARHIIMREEWDFWVTNQAAKMLGEHSNEVLLKIARKNLPPVQGQIDLVDHETEIITGITALAAPGHTPGHMVLDISSGAEQLLCVADAVLHPLHLEYPEWYSIFDVIPEQVVATRRSLLDGVAAEKIMVLAFHFPFPGLGHVVSKDDTWRWQPIEQ